MEARAALWTLVGIFVVFKVATTIMIILASPDGGSNAIWLFVVFHWPFMILGLIFAVAPLLFWARLVRVRAKRARLQAAEWRIDQQPAP